PLDEPWGVAVAPKGFGPFAGKLLVGNLGNGWINVFNPTTGAYLGALDGTGGYPIAIPGLWDLRVGDAAFGGTNALVFSSGPNNYTNGLVGILTPAG
ncbi:MAG TPA: TIGR03118 family protein, partial [Acidimicrobiales bacterium]|nr:TIGR03118 family protein [Acidimicrobiales bacterium]